MSGELVALSQNWLDATTDPATGRIKTSVGHPVSATVTTMNCSNSLLGSSTVVGNSCWTPYYWCYTTNDRRPIRLGYSEIEKLRQAAKRDAKLKKILQKFTDLIEVAVDFE